MDNLKTTLSKFNSNFSMKEFKNSEYIQFPIINAQLPYGSFVEILGEPSKGKSTLALLIADYISRKNKVVLYIDGEHSLDLFYLRKLNIDEDILIVNLDEELRNTIDLICDLSKSVDLIVLDSLACLDYLNIKKDLGKLIKTISHSNCSLIYTNQMRTNIKAKKIVSYGGNELKKVCVLRLEVKKMTKIDTISFEINVIKNKLSAILGEQIYNFKI